MLVVFTDEAGDDKDDAPNSVGVENTIKICQRYGMPVYVVGVPALFGGASHWSNGSIRTPRTTRRRNGVA